ncbi:MAG: cytochrome c oxidase assembly protein [Dehalococcoidia bacterium]
MLAHEGHTVEFSWTDWGGDPSVVVGVFLLEGLYLLAVFPMRQRYGWAGEVDPKRVVSFTLGVWAIFLALYSPLDVLSDEFLFSAHMVQHLILTLVAPPLLLMGTPGWLLRPLVRSPQVFRTAKVLTHPIAALLLFNGVFAAWHIPSIYEAGLNHLSVHIIQHLLFMATGVLMWWPILSPLPELPRLPYAGQVLYLFSLSIPPAIVGGLITFSDDVLYATYASAPRIWGLSAAADQQIGGVMMKLPGFLIFIVAATIIFFTWVAKEEARDRVEAAERLKNLR